EGKIEFLEAVSKIPSEEREDAIEKLADFPHDLVGASNKEKISVLQALSAISGKEERSHVIDQLKKLSSAGMKVEGKIELLQVVSRLPSKERESIVDKASPFFKLSTSIKERILVLEAIKEVPEERREE